MNTVLLIFRFELRRNRVYTKHTIVGFLLAEYVEDDSAAEKLEEDDSAALGIEEECMGSKGMSTNSEFVAGALKYFIFQVVISKAIE